MAKLGIDVSKAGGRFCSKPKCKRTNLHRHHKGHEYIFVALWTRVKVGDREFQKFARRYWGFLKTDTVDVCDWHHAEIHASYDKIINNHIVKVGAPLSRFTWKEARALMQDLTRCCNSWLKYVSPGIEPIRFRRDYDDA